MSGTITFVDHGVRKMMADMIKESEGKKRNPYVEKFTRYKKKHVGDPWNTQSITDSDGKTTRWKDLSDDYAAEKYAYKKENLQFRSPTGKPIQAPWNYETGCMMKIPPTMKVRVPEALKRKLILIRNGALKRGIIPKKSFARGKIQFVVTVKGFAKKYAWFHMFGAPNRKARNGSPNPLPARPFMVWTRQDITELIKILYQWVADKTR